MHHGDDRGTGEHEDITRGEEEVLLGLRDQCPELDFRGCHRPREAKYQHRCRRQEEDEEGYQA